MAAGLLATPAVARYKKGKQDSGSAEGRAVAVAPRHTLSHSDPCPHQYPLISDQCLPEIATLG